jgi:hypothetical protein
MIYSEVPSVLVKSPEIITSIGTLWIIEESDLDESSLQFPMFFVGDTSYVFA